MKKMLFAIAALVLSAAMLSAQDMATATETYNNGAEALATGDKAAALNYFQKALAMGQECGDDGAELVANCKNVIPGIILSLGKEAYNNKDFDSALEKVNEALAVAKEYGNEDIAVEAEALVSQVTVRKTLSEADDAFKAKEFAAAAEGYQAVLALEPTNKNASIRLVQSLANAGDIEGAKAAYPTAVENGKEADANKVLGGALLKKAASELKLKKFGDAADFARESLTYQEAAQAYLIIGQSSTQLKKNAEAITAFEKYLELDPAAKNAGQIALTVGALYQGQNDKAKALEYYKKAQAAGVDAKQYIDALSK